MEQPDRLYRDYRALEERLSRLSAASLRINESLEVRVACRDRLNGLRRKLKDDALGPQVHYHRAAGGV